MEQLETFLSKHRRELVALARRRRAPEPEDCVQDASRKLYQRVHNGKVEEGSLQRLANTIVVRTAIDQIRRARHREKVVADEDLDKQIAFTMVDFIDANGAYTRLAVRMELENRPPQQRALAWVLTKDNTITDLTEATGQPDSTLSSQAAKLRKELRKRLAWLKISVIVWLVQRRWAAAMGLAAAATFLLIMKPGPGCSRTVDDDGYAVTYKGQCAIGFTGLADPELESAPSPVPGVMMLLRGTAKIGIRTDLDKKRGDSTIPEQAIFAHVDEGSYALLVNLLQESVWHCDTTGCRSVAASEHVISGTQPIRRNRAHVALEELLVGSTKRPPPRRALYSLSTPLLVDCSLESVYPLMPGYTISLIDDQLYHPKNRYPFRDARCRNRD